MKKMAAGSFKTNCLAVMDEVQARHETVVITKHGKPVAKLVPVNTDTDEIYDFLAGRGVISNFLLIEREHRRSVLTRFLPRRIPSRCECVNQLPSQRLR
jgi:prevent-host-death family protein